MKTKCRSGDMCCKCAKKQLIASVCDVEEQERIHEATMELVHHIHALCRVCHKQSLGNGDDAANRREDAAAQQSL